MLKSQMLLNGRAQLLCQAGIGWYHSFALRTAPHWIGKVTVMPEARNDMPVQVWYHIAQAGQVDLVRIEHLPDGSLNCKDDLHQFIARGNGKIGHFFYVLVQDDPAEAWVVLVIDEDDAA